MGISVKREAAVPPGEHKGIIIGCRELMKDFKQGDGKEPTIEITIQPAWRSDDGAQTLPIGVSFSPVLNGLSALSQLLKRLGMTPAEGAVWEPASLIGTEVVFACQRTQRGFVNVLKETIRKP